MVRRTYQIVLDVIHLGYLTQVSNSPSWQQLYVPMARDGHFISLCLQLLITTVLIIYTRDSSRIRRWSQWYEHSRGPYDSSQRSRPRSKDRTLDCTFAQTWVPSRVTHYPRPRPKPQWYLAWSKTMARTCLASWSIRQRDQERDKPALTCSDLANTKPLIRDEPTAINHHIVTAQLPSPRSLQVIRPLHPRSCECCSQRPTL